MAKDKYNDPANYRALSEPHDPEKLQESIDGFIEECRAARQKYRIPDVHIIIDVNTESGEGEEGVATARTHFGDPTKAQQMLARALGNQERMDKDYMERLLAASRRGK